MVKLASLAQSAEDYYDAQYRIPAPCTLRLQWKGNTCYHEEDGPISKKLASYLAMLSANRVSYVAGSSVKYAAVNIRALFNSTIKVQVAGPEFNRVWGASFILPFTALGSRLREATNDEE